MERRTFIAGIATGLATTRLSAEAQQGGKVARTNSLSLTSGPGTLEYAAPSPRPFYIIGHNPNTIDDVKAALANGANAIEPDVNVFAEHPDQLCINHGEGTSDTPTLAQYLTRLHKVVAANAKLALVVFDCKTKASTAAHGYELLQAIRQYLTFDNDLNIIISIPSRSNSKGAIFDRISRILTAREGLMIDWEKDPTAVAGYFSTLGVENQGYGNGISVFNSIIGPFSRSSLELACELRASTNRPKFIEAWTVNCADDMREYIRIGVDSIITGEVGKLASVTRETEFTSLIRQAQRSDNPFRPTNATYGLAIRTGDVPMAGTDADVAFTLIGALGSATTIVNTNLINRMERNDRNYVTIQCCDLGDLDSIMVQRDNSGHAPDWFLDEIIVRSYRFRMSKQATFNCWINTTAPFTQALV